MKYYSLWRLEMQHFSLLLCFVNVVVQASRALVILCLLSIPPPRLVFEDSLFGGREPTQSGVLRRWPILHVNLGTVVVIIFRYSWGKQVPKSPKGDYFWFVVLFVVLLKLGSRFYIYVFSIPCLLTSLQDLTQKHLQDLWNNLLLWQTCICFLPGSSTSSSLFQRY